MKVISVSESGNENSATIQSETNDDSKKISTEVQDLLKAHNDDKTEKYVTHPYFQQYTVDCNFNLILHILFETITKICFYKFLLSTHRIILQYTKML